MKFLLTKRLVYLYSFFFSLFITAQQSSDNIWLKNEVVSKAETKEIFKNSLPDSYKVYQLNVAELKKSLSSAPERGIKSNTVISFPNADGELEKFRVFEASVMHPTLQAKYPNIRSYAGQGIDNPASRIRFSVSHLGFKGMNISAGSNTVIIEPLTKNAGQYIIYNKKENKSPGTFECEVEDELTNRINNSQNTSTAKNADDGILRKYRLAMSATGEYTDYFGGTKADALAAINATMTRVNGVFEVDFNITTELIANTDEVIYIDADTDPYTGTSFNDQLQNTLTDVIGEANYDIGHLVTRGSDNGNAGCIGCVCVDGEKGSGFTSFGSPEGDFFDIDFVAHEMGHQFGANHTWTFNGSEGTGVQMEPGSGSTIMGYAGITGATDVQDHSDPYFHAASIRQVTDYVKTTSCQTDFATGNNVPTADAGMDYTIPKGTAFTLVGDGTDTDGDALSFCWEQIDQNAASSTYPSTTSTTGVSFRSFNPSTIKSRTFPKMETVLAGSTSSQWEAIPNVGRDLNFRLTVRDNVAGGGTNNSDDVLVTVDDATGPFVVTSQATTESWDAGTKKTVTWDVANTDAAPVNCANVNILMSIDNGLTFPITVASNVPNNGSYDVLVPNSTTTEARIKIEAVDNIFFAVNAAKIEIQASEFIMEFESYTKSVCEPNSVVYAFNYKTFLGFTEETTFSADNLPAGTTAVFSPATATADGTRVEMTISGLTNSNIGNYAIAPIGTSATVTKTFEVNLDVYSPTISTTTLLLPANDAVNVLQPYTLSWDNDLNATSYELQISETSDFASIKETATISEAMYDPQLLELNTDYYWKVKSINDCGESSFSEVRKFKTVNIECKFDDNTVSEDIPEIVSEGITKTISTTHNKSILSVIVTVDIVHPNVEDLILKLISPQGTEVTLVSNLAANGANYTSTVFDMEAANSINTGTAPYTGSFIPQGDLSVFNGEESFGDWQLNIVDAGFLNSGSYTSWGIEICGYPIESDDNDNDGVLNDDDLCPNTPDGETVDANGCSNGQLDDDNDGVINSIDVCDGTPAGTIVDETGCEVFMLAENNFSIEVTGETCTDKNNGQINITALENHNYKALINGQTLDFTSTLLIEGLDPGSYELCIEIEEEDYEQCFTIVVEEGTSISGKTTISSNRASFEIEEGEGPFTVLVNGVSVLTTSQSVFNVEVKHGDLISVKTAKDCEGEITKKVSLFNEIVAYPNPTKGSLDIAIPVSQKEVLVQLFNIQSQLILTKTVNSSTGRVNLDLSNLPKGVYIARVEVDGDVKTLKVIRE
ncbi:Por secretion system C-terminal sorting domain-containing protein [Lutibacter oricola]|uniref:Por secretion system C-terminal sorting domain-containing protein n=1 Tax=Lutibacter oricola TaxID=762486 RepID=A0A1H2RRT5_9FLAO|nr:zinc-dependent metalloprotease family protein [Lutibacter oricola]SDW22121.1 Por secretion system C-terminal sorting domain-containing protein [Lutibacter oricola]